MKTEDFEKMRVGGQFMFAGVGYTVKWAEIYGGKACSLVCDGTNGSQNGRVKIIDAIVADMELIRYEQGKDPEVT